MDSMDSNDVSSRPISRRAVVLGMGAGGLALALGGIGFIEARKAHASWIPGSQGAAPSDAAFAGTTVYTYRGHTGVVNVAVWSPSNVRIASGSADKSVHVWHATTGRDVLV